MPALLVANTIQHQVTYADHQIRSHQIQLVYWTGEYAVAVLAGAVADNGELEIFWLIQEGFIGRCSIGMHSRR
jgi:hypothetical protein